MNNIRSFVQRFSLPIFFVLAYTLSWTPSLFEAHSLLPLGPLFAALIVLPFIGVAAVKDLLRRIVQWRRKGSRHESMNVISQIAY